MEVSEELILFARNTLFALLLIAIPSVGMTDCIYLECDRLSPLKKAYGKTGYPEIPLVQITTKGSCEKPFARRTTGQETGLFTFSPSYQNGVSEHNLIITPRTYSVLSFNPLVVEKMVEINRMDLSATFYDSNYQCRVISHGEAWDIYESFSLDQKI